MSGIYCYVFILFLLLFSCKSDLAKRELKQTKVTDLQFEASTLKLSEIGSNIRYVSLTPDSNLSLIGDNPERIQVANKMIVILDRSVSKTLYVYDTTGKLQYKKTDSSIIPFINEKNNPDATITDFCLDSERDELLVLIANAGVVLSFDLQSGKIKQKRALMPRMIFNGINITDSKKLLLSNSYNQKYSHLNQFHLCMYDTSGRFELGWLPAPLKGLIDKYPGQSLTTIGSDGSQLLFTRFGNDTIYSLKGDSLVTKYLINFSNIDIGSLTKGHASHSVGSEKAISWDYATRASVTKVMANDRYMFYQVLSADGISITCLHDKKNSNGKVYSSVDNDLSLYPLSSFPYFINDEVYVSFISGTSMNKINKFYGAREKGLSTSNPVVVLLNFN